MRKESITRVAAIGAILALGAAPAALAERPADPGAQGNGQGGGQGKSGEHGKSGTKTVKYVFKGTFDGTSAVAVDHGNAHVKRAGLIGETVSFDLTTAKVSVTDANASGTADLADVAANDRVVVKARLPRKQPGAQPFTAKQIVDQTQPAVSG